MPDDDQDGVGYCDRCLLSSSSVRQSTELSAEVGVFGAYRRMGRLHQGGAQPTDCRVGYRRS